MKALYETMLCIATANSWDEIMEALTLAEELQETAHTYGEQAVAGLVVELAKDKAEEEMAK